MILDEILEKKRGEVERSKERVPEAGLRAGLADIEPPRDFLGSFRSAPRTVHLLAEIKCASPSAGVIRREVVPAALAAEYEAAGAAAISVLTDQPFFGGRLADLTAVRRAVRLPVLRKDFIIDPYQVIESRAAGADAILLMAQVLSGPEMARLLALAHEWKMTALTECHTEGELEKVLQTDARLIGINTRDFTTMTIDLETARRLLPKVPDDRTVIVQSGVHTAADVKKLRQWGVRAIQVGTELMRSDDPTAKIRELLA